MADPKLAVQFVLRQEDARLAGTITNGAHDRGGLTRFGLCAKFHPELVVQGFFSPAMPAAAALPLAERAYEVCYTGPLFLDQIRSQAVANALLSFAVNEGNHQAILLLQKAAIGGGAPLSPDGRLGPATVAAVNAANPAALLARYGELEADFYRRLAASDPSQQANLNGWLNREKQNATQAV